LNTYSAYFECQNKTDVLNTMVNWKHLTIIHEEVEYYTRKGNPKNCDVTKVGQIYIGATRWGFNLKLEQANIFRYISKDIFELD